MLKLASKLKVLMQFSQILHKITQNSGEKLPGFDAQLKLSPPYRQKLSLEDINKYGPKQSAVMLLLYKKHNEPHIVFTERQEYKGVHSKQISFPGGRFDNTDKDLAYTALRETHEEIGIKLNSKQVVNKLTWLYVPPSNFMIQPFIAFAEKELQFTREEKEVKSIIEVPLLHFLEPKVKSSFDYYIKSQKTTITCPCYKIDEHIIWGATAMILSEFLTILEK